MSLSAELSSSFLALSPLFSPSGRLSAELLSSFLLLCSFLSADDKDHDDLTKDWRLLSLLAIVIFSRSLSPLLSFCSSVSRAIVFCLLFSPFLSDDGKDHDDLTNLSLFAELLCSLLAVSPLFPPSGRLSAELSSSSLACSPFPLRRRR